MTAPAGLGLRSAIAVDDVAGEAKAALVTVRR
jgi:hypothetical protein